MTKQSYLVGITFYNDARNYLEQNKVKSLSNTLNWFILEYKRTQGQVPTIPIEGTTQDKQKTLRISQEAKEFILSNKVANSISFTINTILIDAKKKGIRPQADI